MVEWGAGEEVEDLLVMTGGVLIDGLCAETCSLEQVLGSAFVMKGSTNHQVYILATGVTFSRAIGGRRQASASVFEYKSSVGNGENLLDSG